MYHTKLYRIDYSAGKARSKESAENLRKRTQVILDLLGNGQVASIHTIKNAHGTYGYRVNVVSREIDSQ